MLEIEDAFSTIVLQKADSPPLLFFNCHGIPLPHFLYTREFAGLLKHHGDYLLVSMHVFKHREDHMLAMVVVRGA